MNIDKKDGEYMELYPLTFEEIYKEKIWGGKGLEKIYNRRLPNNKIGESWEVAAHPHGMSIVKNGIYKGKSLIELINKYPNKILGYSLDKKIKNYFPLLVKIIDANEKLSVQVHPDDDYASRVENEAGKTEMWYILAAKPGAKLVYGLKPGTKRKDFAEAVKKGFLEKYLNEIEVKKGDIIYMPAGTIHAIEEGVLLAEIQQNSDTTYRIYDWNRVGIDGESRDLHIEKALDVINFSEEGVEAKSTPLSLEYRAYKRSFLAACPYFTTEKIEVRKEYILNPDNSRFHVLLNLKGQGNILCDGKIYQLNPGNTYFLPAGLQKVRITGQVEFLLTYLESSKEEIINLLSSLNFSEEKINNLPGLKNWD